MGANKTTGVITVGKGGFKEGPYLCASGWDKTECRSYEVYEYKLVGEIGKQPAAPRGAGSLVEITADNDRGVTRWKFRFETVFDNEEGAKRVRGFTTETPIYKHKDFKLMFAWYGLWIDRGRVTWKSYFPGVPKIKKESGYAAKAGQDETYEMVTKVVFEAAPEADFTKTSPLAGVQVFHEAKIEVEKTRVVYGRSIGAFGLGKIDMPTGVQAITRKKWIKSGIKISPRGNGYIVSEYWLQNNMNPKSLWAVDYAGPVAQGVDQPAKG